MVTRRALLGAGALGALAAAGCGDRARKPPTGGDAAVLGTLRATQSALAGAWAPVDRDVAARQRAHTAALTAAGAGTGGPVPADVARVAPNRVSLLAAERAAGEAMLAALPELRDANSRELVMSQYAAGAQHQSLLLAALGRDPLPDAFAGTLA